MTPAKRRNFERMLNPRHIAFIGGTDAAIAIGEAERAGFTGQIRVVNPKRETLAGHPCVPDIASLPEAPDAVFLAIPAALIPAAVTELAQMGAGGIVCYAAGFSEAHEDGRALEEALKAALDDMVLIGPNCYGLINYVGKSALWPFAHGGGCAGEGVAIITQSGMFSSDITMSQRSLPLAYMISVGNQADLEIADFVDLMAERDEVRAIGLHIEGLLDVGKFERAALRAIEAGKPIVALKTGSSAIGEALTISHTGSLAGSDALYRALFRRCGIIAVTNPSQMLETLKFLSVAGAPDGTALAGFTCSGGGATMLADHAETIGLSFPAPDETARAELTKLLPPIATVSNPLDYTTPIWGQPDKTEPVFATALSMIPAQATVLVQDYPAPGLDESEHFYLNDGLAFARAARAAGLPAAICATLPENMGAKIRDRYVAEGIAPMQGIHETLNAIRDAAQWSADRARILSRAPAPLTGPRPTAAGAYLTEAQGKAHLAAAGIAVPEGRLCGANALCDNALEIGFPLVLKMMSPDLAHKTEAGAVALNLQNADALAAAAAQMRQDVARYNPEAVSDEFLIERMAAPPLAELIVGIRQDPQFGLTMTIGSGGILVELIEDSHTLLLPTHPEEISAALRSLRVWRLLNGYRGRAAVDCDMLARHLQGLADLALSKADEITEIEINPLFVYENSVLAVDCLMRTTA